MKPRITRFLMAASLMSFAAAVLSAESVVIVNRTGRVLDLIQAAPLGTDHWGDDLIPERVLVDGESVTLDLIGQAPWSFRFLDSEGEVYVLYEVLPSLTGKLSVGPEHQARLSILAGPVREIQISNRTGYTMSAFRVSAVTDGTWGADILSGRYVRNGESVSLEISARPGTLSFDISFTLVSDGKELTYEKGSIILTDGASLVLTAR